MLIEALKCRSRTAKAGVNRLWHPPDIFQKLNGRLRHVLVLLYGYDPGGLGAERVRHMENFDHRCLRSMIWIV